MSEDNKNNDGSAVTQEPSQAPVEQKEEGYVPKKAYEEVTKDLHKFKSRAKEAEARANEFEAQMKAQEEQRMQEQEQWKQLYEKRDSELASERQRIKEIEDRHLRSQKTLALKQELGVNVKDEYLQFANFDGIVINDGVVDRDSLREVANSFRKEHGQLLPSSENVNITGQSPNTSSVTAKKDFSKMSSRELMEEYAKQKANNQ